MIEPDQQVVSLVAEHRDPTMVARHLIENVAVNEQETPAVGGFVNQLINHFDLAENDAAVVAQSFVVVAGNKHHPLAMPRPTQQFLDDSVLCRRPVNAAAHRPEVDDVADQISLFSLVFAEEIEQTIRLARPRAEVDVGEKN